MMSRALRTPSESMGCSDDECCSREGDRGWFGDLDGDTFGCPHAVRGKECPVSSRIEFLNPFVVGAENVKLSAAVER